MADFRQLAWHSRRQHHLVTIQQLVSAGFTKDQTYGMVQSGRLEKVRPGVMRIGGAQPTWHSAALAAVLTARGDAVRSHRSAAALWGRTGLARIP